jgi:two-component system, cell cycle response regulator
MGRNRVRATAETTSTLPQPGPIHGGMEAAAVPTPVPEAGACVLIADDDPDILGLLAFLLERDGYSVVKAADGLAALRLARECRPDLCVLDLSMPGVDGYAVCRELQALGSTAPPVIFLTAHAHTGARVEGLDAGAVDYIVKPFNREELRARVRAALRTKTARDQLAVEAVTDPLTGLMNRANVSVLDEHVATARRTGSPLAVLMIDLDHFKNVNDLHGHVAGDAVLRQVARRFMRAMRDTDVLIRFGGEEFLALLTATDTIGAVTMAARLRESLEDSPIIVVDGGEAVEITMRASVGVAPLREGRDTAAVLIEAADKALYRAKSLGRDRVELAE